MTYEVLMIGDPRRWANLFKPNLADIGCRVSLALDGASGLLEVEGGRYDLVIIDRTLPGDDGIDICRKLRTQIHYPPILMLSSRASELERILGLEMGADDFLSAPFDVLELVARVKAIFRRVKEIKHEVMKAAATSNQSSRNSETVRTRGMVIDADKRSVALNHRAVELTAKEFELLLHLARNPGRVYSREQLLDAVWGYEHAGYQHTVNSHINRLRAKIEQDPGNPVYVRTVWGVGYKFSEAPEIDVPERPQSTALPRLAFESL